MRHCNTEIGVQQKKKMLRDLITFLRTFRYFQLYKSVEHWHFSCSGMKLLCGCIGWRCYRLQQTWNKVQPQDQWKIVGPRVKYMQKIQLFLSNVVFSWNWRGYFWQFLENILKFLFAFSVSKQIFYENYVLFFRQIYFGSGDRRQVTCEM